MNKVLNRPMFRKEALKKGHLKPIKANIGTMVGQPYSPPGVPALLPGQGVFSPVNTQRFGPPKPTRMQNVMRSAPVRFLKQGINIPTVGGYIAGEQVAKGLGIKDPLMQMPFGLAGSYYATKALPGLASLPVATSAALMAGPAYLMYAGGKERERLAKMTPKERAEYSRMSRIKATEGEAGGFSDADLFGKFVPKAPEPIKPKTSAVEPGKPAPGQGRVGIDRAKLKQEGDTLLSDQFEGPEGDASLDKIQMASIGPVPPEGDKPPQLGGASSEEQARKTTEGQTPNLTASEALALKSEDNQVVANEVSKGGVSDDPDFNKVIKLAKKYNDEVYKGQGSQAGLLFLANLASGLLTGTTRKGGVGGAMEVLGQALGPAVNNYVTVKLKEGELRQRSREASLNAALDHMKFVNENARVERPDQTGGVVQIRGVDGRLRNYKAYQMKDGTITMASGIGPDGRERFVAVPQGSPITTSGPDGIAGNEDDVVIGNFEDFKSQSDISKTLVDIQDVLGNRYDALATSREVLKIIGQEEAKAGAALSIDQFTRRISGVAKELLGGSTIDPTDLNSNLADLERLYKDELKALDRALASGEITESEYERDKKAIEIGEFKGKKGGLIEEARKQILKNSGLKGFYSGLTREQQESLAVYETKLVYALANTFKDQDRLTQRDIDAAREIVNIFSLARSSADVRASIQAIARGLESDIRRQEKLFVANGGLESTLQDLRSLKDFKEFESKQDLVSQFEKDLSLEEIEQGLEDVNL